MSNPGLLISPESVGLQGIQRFTASFRDISNFAAAIADTNPRYFNSQGCIAHPVFPVTFSWQSLQSKDSAWGKIFSEDVRSRMIHYDEFLQFNGTIKPGDELTANGQLIGMEPHKLGSKIQVRILYQNQIGEVVVTEYVSALLVGIPCHRSETLERSPIQVENIDNQNAALWEEAIIIDKTAPYLYDGCTDISSPIHTDEHFARSLGLPGIIYHGTASLARSVSAIIIKELDGDASRVHSVSAKFIGKLSIPNALHVRLLSNNNKHLNFIVLDNNGQLVLAGNLTYL